MAQIIKTDLADSTVEPSTDEVQRHTAPVRVACLGAGFFARFHHDAWQRISNAMLVAIADSDIARAQQACSELMTAEQTRDSFKGRRKTSIDAFSSLVAMLDSVNPQLLDIITPPHTHLESIAAGIEAGVPTIVCQKPFCQSLDEARQAVALARAAGIVLVVHENIRFQPWYRAIAQQLADNAIGQLQQVTFRLRPGDGQGPDAYLNRQPYFQTMPRLLIHETAVHWIDTFGFLVGPIKAVYADLRRLNPVITGEDAGHVLFDFANGVRALFDGNRHLDHAAGNTRLTLGEALVEGTTGTLKLDGDGSVHHRQFGHTDSSTLLAAREWPGFGGDCVRALQQHVIDALVYNSPLENEAQEYLRVLEIEAAIYESAEREKKIRV